MKRTIKDTIRDWKQKRELRKANAHMKARLTLQESPKLAGKRMKLRKLRNHQERIDEQVERIGAGREFEDIPMPVLLRMYALFMQRCFIDYQIDGIMNRLTRKEFRRMQRKAAMDGLQKLYVSLLSRKKKASK